MTSKITVEIDRDAHDDTYYHVLSDSHILIDRINDFNDLMLYLGAKIKRMQ